MVKSPPGPALELVGTENLPDVLVKPLDRPAKVGPRDQLLQRGIIQLPTEPHFALALAVIGLRLVIVLQDQPARFLADTPVVGIVAEPNSAPAV